MPRKRSCKAIQTDLWTKCVGNLPVPTTSELSIMLYNAPLHGKIHHVHRIYIPYRSYPTFKSLFSEFPFCCSPTSWKRLFADIKPVQCMYSNTNTLRRITHSATSCTISNRLRCIYTTCYTLPTCYFSTPHISSRLTQSQQTKVTRHFFFSSLFQTDGRQISLLLLHQPELRGGRCFPCTAPIRLQHETTAEQLSPILNRHSNPACAQDRSESSPSSFVVRMQRH